MSDDKSESPLPKLGSNNDLKSSGETSPRNGADNKPQAATNINVKPPHPWGNQSAEDDEALQDLHIAYENRDCGEVVRLLQTHGVTSPWIAEKGKPFFPPVRPKVAHNKRTAAGYTIRLMASTMNATLGQSGACVIIVEALKEWGKKDKVSLAFFLFFKSK